MNNQTKHTPGPWTISRCPANRHRWRIYAEIVGRTHPACIAETASWLPSDPPEESEANAHLIAAAPETAAECNRLQARYVALIPVVEAAVAWAVARKDREDVDVISLRETRFWRAVRDYRERIEARTAVAKAEGA